MAIIQVHCFKCGTVSEYADNVGFRSECESCGEDQHVCKNCRFYDPGSYNECKETSADVVKEKERSNYCEYFQAKGSGDSEGNKKDQLKAAAEALFKKK